MTPNTTTTTNGKAFANLSPEEQKQFSETYANHPLKDFIDWRAYYDSLDGNALNFVVCLSEYHDEEGKRVFVLKEFVEEDCDYLLIYVCEDNMFYKIPDERDKSRGEQVDG